MTGRILTLEDLEPPRSRWEAVLEATMALLLAFMPFALGAVEAWSELITIVLAGALAMMLAMRLIFDGRFRPVWTWAYVPLALFLLLATVQLVELPSGVLQQLSPPTIEMRTELQGPAVADRPGSISLYPHATAHSLRMALVGFVVFAGVVALCRDTSQIKRLLFWVALVGAAQALLALLQIFIGTDRIYGLIEVRGHVTSGSFINYSNFSQFMNLSIGAGLALLLVRLEEGSRAVRRQPMHPVLNLSRLQEHGGLTGVLVLSAVAVFTSMSRNGAVSMLVAAAVVGTALFWRGTLSRRGWLLAIVPLATLGGLLATSFDAVYERLATLQPPAFADRWELTSSVLRAWQNFPVWGAGLGTHEYVFPQFDSTGVTALAIHADNDYAQLLEETGVVGASLAAALVGIIVFILIGLCRRGRTVTSAGAFGLLFGVIAVAIHSASDFGQRIPAVFCLSAVLCGVAVSIRRLERLSAVEPSPAAWLERPLLRRSVGVATVVALTATFTWAIHGAVAAYRAEAWRGVALALESEIETTSSDVTDEELDELYGDLIAASEAAARNEPKNVVYGYWLNYYRWQAISGATNPETGEIALHPDSIPVVERIADELASVRQLCP
ncbi:MAG: O-antigen ligase family protein, partial [Pirellulales bacterium]|nr:O-antigen ligase family protein [Pirellulales bacterium]